VNILPSRAYQCQVTAVPLRFSGSWQTLFPAETLSRPTLSGSVLAILPRVTWAYYPRFTVEQQLQWIRP